MRIDFLLIMDYVAYEIADTHIRLLTDLFEEQYSLKDHTHYKGPKKGVHILL